jgi:glucosamine--fructose-6-phosphate aminotransferase (isomerizing)
MSGTNSSVRGSYTLAEILSQPEVWRSWANNLANDAGYQAVRSQARSRKAWLFTGCGTSFYLAEAAAAAWTTLTRQPARAVPCSELLLFPNLAQLGETGLQAVIISRSGTTSEAVRAAEVLNTKFKLPTVGITCVPDSDLAKKCDLTIGIPNADEKSMVMTRSFSSMLLTIMMLAAECAGDRTVPAAVVDVAGQFASRIEGWSEKIGAFIGEREFDDYIYLAQGPFFPIAREAALKITEMSVSYAQAYHTLEFRHGPKSIVGPQACITFLLSKSGGEAESEVLTEMKELGGTIVAVCDRASETVRKAADLLLELNSGAPELALLAPFVAPMQLLGYHTGMKKGLNPDEPKNLSRVVILD